MTNLLTNHLGRDYRVVESGDEDSWTFRARTDGYEMVAYAFLEEDADRTLVLADIWVNEAVREAKAWWNCFGLGRVRSFRGFGLGSALFARVLERAMEEGFRVIEGRITSNDAGCALYPPLVSHSAMSRLVAWCLRRCATIRRVASAGGPAQ